MEVLTKEQIAFWCKDVPAYREEKGFITNWANIRAKLMLVVTEIAEMAECIRHGQWELCYQKTATPGPSTLLAKPEGFPIEVADVAIRIFDIAGSIGIDLWIGYETAMNFVKRVPDDRMKSDGDFALESLVFTTSTATEVVVNSMDRTSLNVFTGALLGILLSHMSAYAFELGFNLNAMIELKMAYNRQRPYRHGTVNGGA
jgi:hypothetical protein